jgi:hypothetical protein
MTTPLDDFINAVRMAETVEQERFLIATEEAHIRAYVREGDPELRPRIVSKLVYLDMLGENPTWGQIEAITLMTHDVFSYKRVGYIGGSILLDENADLTVLVTHTLLKDLQSPDSNVQSLALTFIANVGSPEVCRSVATAVQKTVSSRSPSVLKRAGMAIVRIVRKNPDLTETFKNTVQRLLNHNSHGVIISGMNAVICMLEMDSRLMSAWSQFSVPFTKILKNLSNSRGSREFNYGVFNDPYMLMKTMRALSLLGKASDELDGILQSIISSTETRRNTGRAVLYEAVDTVVCVSGKASLRGLAFNQVGRLLSMRDPNVLYSALSSFARVLYREQSMINRGSVDSMALQRYKSAVVKCLDHNDPSIRRRALDVISALIDETNVETLIPEILAYVRLADAEFRSELIAKIYSASQRFSPSPEWNFDTVHDILVDSGNYVSAEILASFCELIGKSGDLQPHAVSRLSSSIREHGDNQSIVQVSAFVLGEFAREDSGIMESLRHLIVLPQTTIESQLYILTALAKLATRFGRREETIDFLSGMETSNHVELQQRAGELHRLLLIPQLCAAVLAPVASASAMSEEKSAQIASPRAGSGPSIGGGQGSDDEVDDLLLLVMDDAAGGGGKTSSVPGPQLQSQSQSQSTLPPSPIPAAGATGSGGSLSLLGDLSGGPRGNSVSGLPPGVSPGLSGSGGVGTNAVGPSGPGGGRELLRKGDFVIFGQVKSNPQNAKQIALRLLFYNTGSMRLTEFKAEYQIQPGWQLNVQPVDGSILEPRGSPPLTQVLYLFNQTNARFSLHVRVSYQFGAQPVRESGTITSLT